MRCKLTCPVHMFGSVVATLRPGAVIFDGLTADAARRTLRTMLGAVGVVDAGVYGTHDLRRGHVDDMLRAGSSMLEVLVAAGWHKPGSHRNYTDLVALEMRACLEAHCASLEGIDE